MANRTGQRNQANGRYGSPYGYSARPGDKVYEPYGGYGAAPGYGAGYGAGAGYGYTTPGALIQEPWAVTDWEEYYIPTVGGARAKRPVIYIASPLPVGLGGFGGGFGGGLPLGY